MTRQELENYNGFLLKHMELTRKRAIKPIYRGDSLKNLCAKLNVPYDGDRTDIRTLLGRLFIIGEKAQRYYSDEDTFRIDDAEDYVFGKIHKYLKNSIKSNNTNTISFFNRNKNLRDFFSSLTNRHRFLSIIQEANETERFHIRNYYLTLLHQLAAINYKNKSHFVSTSRDYRIAENFSVKSGELDRIILHCWQPIQIERNFVRKYNLPSYSLGPYDYQKEISVLGGILPHFISGIEISQKNEFYPNPNILKSEVSDELFIFGLNIDQSNFQNVFESTNYRKSIVTYGNNMWEQQ